MEIILKNSPNFSAQIIEHRPAASWNHSLNFAGHIGKKVEFPLEIIWFTVFKDHILAKHINQESELSALKQEV